MLGVPPAPSTDTTPRGERCATGIEMARGNPRATFVLGNRRVIAIVQGEDRSTGTCATCACRTRRSPAENLHLLKMFPDAVGVHAVRRPERAHERAHQRAVRAHVLGEAPTTTGIANTSYNLWPVTGNPASGSIAGTAKTANIFTDTSTGAIDHRGNVSSATKHFLGSGVNSTANTPWLMFYDRVLSYDQCPYVATTNETMTNTNVAARYNSGAPGCLMVWVTNTLHGATVTNITQLRYTNQAGSLLQVMPTATTVGITVSGLAPTATLGAKVIAPSTGTTPTWGFSMPMAAGDTAPRS